MRTVIIASVVASILSSASYAECVLVQQSATELTYHAQPAVGQMMPSKNFNLQFHVHCDQPLQSVRLQALSKDDNIFLPSQYQVKPDENQSIELKFKLVHFTAQQKGEQPIDLQLTSELDILGSIPTMRTDLTYQVRPVVGLLSENLNYHGELLVNVRGHFTSSELTRITLPVRLLFNPPY